MLVVAVAPSGVFVVEGAVFEAAVEDADESVGERSQRFEVGVALGAAVVVVGPGLERRRPHKAGGTNAGYCNGVLLPAEDESLLSKPAQALLMGLRLEGAPLAQARRPTSRGSWARRTSLWGSLYGRARAALTVAVAPAVMLMGVAPA